MRVHFPGWERERERKREIELSKTGYWIFECNEETLDGLFVENR